MTDRTITVVITLITYKVILLVIGLLANAKTNDKTEFYLGGRSLGPWVAALSASASSSSAWTLLAVSGAAYQNPKSICPRHHMLLPRVIKG